MPSIKIDETARVSSKASLASGVEIGPYTIIEDDVEIGQDTCIGPHCRIQGPTTLGKSCVITGCASIGTPPQDLKFQGGETRLVIGDKNTIREFVTINRGTEHGGGITKVGSHNLLMAYCHVAHDCIVGDYVVMGNLATLAGHVHVENNVIIGGLSAIHQFTRIGAYAIIGGGSMVSLDIIPYVKASGNRAGLFGINTIGLKRNGFSPERIREITSAYKILFRQGLRLKDALQALENESPESPDIKRLITFISSSDRGIAR